MDTFQTLISPRSLKGQLGRPGWVVVDTRFRLTDPAAGRRAYDEAHLPGAVYAHLDNDLAGPTSATTGRHPLPEPKKMSQTLGRLGISNSSQVVAYDDAGGAIAARLWWMLRWLGHMDVAVLDGGIDAWMKEGFQVSSEPGSSEPAEFEVDPIRTAWLDTTDIESVLGSESMMLLDARSPARFAGDEEPIDKVAGHVPGAINIPFSSNLGDNSRFLDPADLENRYRNIIGDLDPVNVVCMCGSGVTACHNILAMEHAELHGSKLYAGSWSEWITDPNRPVIKEADSG